MPLFVLLYSTVANFECREEHVGNTLWLRQRFRFGGTIYVFLHHDYLSLGTTFRVSRRQSQTRAFDLDNNDDTNMEPMSVATIASQLGTAQDGDDNQDDDGNSSSFSTDFGVAVHDPAAPEPSQISNPAQLQEICVASNFNQDASLAPIPPGQDNERKEKATFPADSNMTAHVDWNHSNSIEDETATTTANHRSGISSENRTDLQNLESNNVDYNVHQYVKDDYHQDGTSIQNQHQQQAEDHLPVTLTTDIGNFKPPLLSAADPSDVIELLDDDDDDDRNVEDSGSQVSSSKRQKLAASSSTFFPSANKILPGQSISSVAEAAAVISGGLLSLPSSLSGVNSILTTTTTTESSHSAVASSASSATGVPLAFASGTPHVRPRHADEPLYVRLPQGFTPSWTSFLPPASFAAASASSSSSSQAYRHSQSEATSIPREKSFQLSLLNVNEFTITGLPVRYDVPPTPVAGLRAPIKQVSRGHGKAYFERDDKEGDGSSGGKWRIPLGAYHAFVAFLTSDPHTQVDGIPQHQLQIASLERARQEKGYPTVEKVVELGVPMGLAKALAPFQRGGVEFVVEKGGRALLADGMMFRVTSVLVFFVFFAGIDRLT